MQQSSLPEGENAEQVFTTASASALRRASSETKLPEASCLLFSALHSPNGLSTHNKDYAQSTQLHNAKARIG
ncbi:hypothetical protein Y1Q_0003160 [Alligator mississippiensis]|uniref:Uncharacterized protein n=1 Tax=Alligator mississippiensis TaxID=8496 RepID=A0A151MDP3_ALLMI|nr:hypothetical protein Y1Q_0003160 [Alligator mississippiensis]